MSEKIWIAKDGFPVEHIEGRWFTNWLCDLIHGRELMTRDEWNEEQHRRRVASALMGGSSTRLP
jgi:hypothetical protein